MTITREYGSWKKARRALEAAEELGLGYTFAFAWREDGAGTAARRLNPVWTLALDTEQPEDDPAPARDHAAKDGYTIASVQYESAVGTSGGTTMQTRG